MVTTREAVVAGQFYPGTKAGLEKMLSGLTERGKTEDICGAMSPHAGYIYSGGVAGKVLSRMKKHDLFVIIGPNHTGRGEPFSVFPKGRWSTPLGVVEIDDEFADYLISKSKIFKPDQVAHIYEHSIEVQIPFLQYMMKDFKIVPIIIGSMDIKKLKEAGTEIGRAIKALKRDAAIIASSDMTHYESQKMAEQKDREALSAILNMNEDDLAGKVVNMDISMCGVAPVITMLSAAKQLGAKKAELVDYKTSGDSSGDYSSVVGYGGVIIK
ncbi:MAG: AmmeMemoRadiSam system protein B [Candidatus Omnitrophica bacterium]|nr:AmmeMemoRadiSam system protein B [Candidatus Omnitrophota bacterium]